MSEISPPPPFDSRFGRLLQSAKSALVRTTDCGVEIAQCGAARLASSGRPPWPTAVVDAADGASIIETYVCGTDAVTATSDNEPFVTAWLPLVDWMNATVRRELAVAGVELVGDAFVTASITPTMLLEGAPHMDDDIFDPDASAQMVAIIAELAGPRVATTALAHRALRPMGQVTFSDSQLAEFASGKTAHCQGKADQLVVFAQFGQLHSGPAAAQLTLLSKTRQLLVMRAATSTNAG